ncbi:hypothetical protein [Bacillus cereus group sp. BfR-BA-01380]|uniref:hypothetical protein n=1 Tax=Bacillus cereus group sp. BfR-BA-01380 TaxID=2920324 RepID=UPI001F55DA17|nr:hypothetical protein [Bacillus cereus group sp. BfR-BA-01380]
MVVSKAKSFVQKLGGALHKGKTVVKTTFLEANKKVQAAIKTLMEYKWIPGTGKEYAIPGGGSVRDAGSLKDAYHFMKETGEKIVGSGGKETEDVSKKASGANIPKIDMSKVNQTANAPKKGRETVVGHALQKQAGRNLNIWGKVKGNSEQINNTAKKHLDEILNAPGDFKVVKSKNGLSFLEKQLSDGRGVRLNMDGTFKGFIDQKR